MSLRATLASVGSVAFAAIGDIAQSASYNRDVTATYNAATGTVSTSSTSVSITAVFSKFNQLELNRAGMKATDLKCMIPQSQLSFVPDIQKDGITYNGKDYSILNVMQDSAGVTYTFQLRAT